MPILINMRKISILLLFVALLTGLTAKADFRFGPKVGVNVAQMHFSSKVLDADNRCGFTGGLTAEYMIPVVNFGFDISLMYSHMKNNVTEVNEVNGVVYEDSYNVSGNFFEIPLHLKYRLGIPAISSILSPYIYTGPSVAFKLGSKDSYANTKSTQWGWDLGLGLELIKRLQIGAGYTFGINKIATYAANQFDYDLNAGHNVKVRNNYWTITAAWMF